MLLCNAQRTNDQGFSLVEISFTLIILGVLAAIAVPSFLGMLSSNKVNDAQNRVRGALQEAQREAISKSKACTVSVPKGDNQTLSSDCFMTGNRTLNGININHDKASTTWQIKFDFKGRTDVNSAGTMVISAANSASKKCVLISEGLGIFRTGDYDETGATPDCKTAR